MKVEIPGFVAPIASARIEIAGKIVFLRPKDRWPIFAADAKELHGIEHLMGPLFVDFPAAAKKSEAKAPAAGE